MFGRGALTLASSSSGSPLLRALRIAPALRSVRVLRPLRRPRLARARGSVRQLAVGGVARYAPLTSLSQPAHCLAFSSASPCLHAPLRPSSPILRSLLATGCRIAPRYALRLRRSPPRPLGCASLLAVSVPSPLGSCRLRGAHRYFRWYLGAVSSPIRSCARVCAAAPLALAAACPPGSRRRAPLPARCARLRPRLCGCGLVACAPLAVGVRRVSASLVRSPPAPCLVPRLQGKVSHSLRLGSVCRVCPHGALSVLPRRWSVPCRCFLAALSARRRLRSVGLYVKKKKKKLNFNFSLYICRGFSFFKHDTHHGQLYS